MASMLQFGDATTLLEILEFDEYKHVRGGASLFVGLLQLLLDKQDQLSVCLRCVALRCVACVGAGEL